MLVQGIPTSTRELILALQAQLVAGTGFDENSVQFSRMARNPRLSGDRDLILRLTGMRSIPGLMEATAQVTPAVTRALIVQMRTRFNVDKSDVNTQWLVDEEFGQSVLEDAVLIALTAFRPIDTSGNCLCIDDILPTEETDYVDELAQIPPDDSTWGSSRLLFKLDYLVASPGIASLR